MTNRVAVDWAFALLSLPLAVWPAIIIGSLSLLAILFSDPKLIRLAGRWLGRAAGRRPKE
jgi:hypothetical protein